MRRSLVTVTVMACALWATPAASAGTVSVGNSYNGLGGQRLVWEGEPGESNDVVVENGPGDTTIVRERGEGARLVSNSSSMPCEVQDRVATCGTGYISEYVLRGHDGNDRLSTQALVETPSESRYFYDYLYGGDGNDVLDALDHTCCLGARLDGGPGDDVMNGGTGEWDEVSYYERSVPLDISLEPRPAGARNGAVGEHDVIGEDIEVVQGGMGDDVIHGDERRNSIWSTGGADTIYGHGGDDSIGSWSGTWDPADDLYGGEGTDYLSPGPKPGVVDGGPGWDSARFDGESWYLNMTLDGEANDGGIVVQQPYWPQRRRTPDGDLRNIESMSAGYLDDFITGDDAQNTIEGYSGSDVIVGNGGMDWIYADPYWGSGGDDFVMAKDGEQDYVSCGPGQDTVVVDQVDSLDECDRVSYEQLPLPKIELPPDPEPPAPAPEYTWSPSPVYTQPPGIPLPGQWFTTPAPENDSQPADPARPACAVLEASPQPKKSVGGPDPECLVGGLGNDRLTGNAGNDQLVGGDGRDRLNGGTGDDWLDGGAGNDSVDGGAHDDMVLGGLGVDSVLAGSGDDVVIASDGARDKIDCGKGRDIVVADRTDRVKRCEVVRRTRRKK
ncbi:MAG: hypothetical protein M3340_18375 [Actinomycetota bacterium]|nr:hypothetical protein [Actinomycetota bacterium]